MEILSNKKTLLVFRKEKNPMQSINSRDIFTGIVDDKNDYIDYEDVNMGWAGSSNTLKQIHLNFDNLDDAKIFAEKYDYNLIVKEAKGDGKHIKKKSYFDNFRKKNS